MLTSNVCQGSRGTAHSEPAYVGIRWISAYVSIRQHTSAYVSIRQHTLAYVQHTAALRLASKKTTRTRLTRERTLALKPQKPHVYRLLWIPPPLSLSQVLRRRSSSKATETTRIYVSVRRHTSAEVSIRQQTLAYVSRR